MNKYQIFKSKIVVNYIRYWVTRISILNKLKIYIFKSYLCENPLINIVFQNGRFYMVDWLYTPTIAFNFYFFKFSKKLAKQYINHLSLLVFFAPAILLFFILSSSSSVPMHPYKFHLKRLNLQKNLLSKTSKYNNFWHYKLISET